MNPELAEQIYAVVRLVPRGRVISYGDVAALFEVNPRLVGRAMSVNEHQDVPWWRITNVYGDLPKHLLEDARVHWLSEGIEMKQNGRGIRIRAHHADLPDLADAAEAALGPLPGATGR